MPPENPFLPIDQQIIGDVYTSHEIMDTITTLCDDFGSRFGGTPGEKEAAEFIKAKLEAYGLANVSLEPFEYIGWRRGQVTLTIIDPIQRELPCISLPHSPPANLEGVLIDLDEGAPDDFDKHADDIQGKIVLTTSAAKPKGSKRWVHRNEKCGRAILAGAIGFIFVNHYPGYGPATGGIGHNGQALIPGISLSREDGAFLQRLIKRHGQVKVRLVSTDQCEPMTSWNIIGELPGQSQPDEIIMLGCHYDGHDISQGAEDPASGAVAVMEAARVLAQYGRSTPRTIRFALWGVEEIGLLGSNAYVQQHQADLDHIQFYLNMDAAGAMKNKGISLNEWPELESLLGQWGQEMTHPFGIRQSVHVHSDHYPFLMAGVPTGGIAGFGPPSTGRGYGHTHYDTLDKIDIMSLREAAVLAARLALRMAHETPWPVQRRSPEAVTAVMDNPDNREEAQFFAALDAHYAQARQAPDQTAET